MLTAKQTKDLTIKSIRERLESEINLAACNGCTKLIFRVGAFSPTSEEVKNIVELLKLSGYKYILDTSCDTFFIHVEW